jgi:hypothetical protein
VPGLSMLLPFNGNGNGLAFNGLAMAAMIAAIAKHGEEAPKKPYAEGVREHAEGLWEKDKRKRGKRKRNRGARDSRVSLTSALQALW